jgi:hypothetical protein
MTRGRWTRHLRPTLVAAAALILLTCAYTWPLVTEMRSAIPHDRGDPLLVTWILWWSTKAVPLTTHWWNAPAFFPSTGVMAFSENLLSLAPITAPLLALTSTPVIAYNVAFVLSYVLSGLAAYVLGLALTARHDAALVAAVAFGFAPYRLSHANHLQLLSSYWMPIALAALHLYIRSSRMRAAAVFSAAWLMQALASGYYLFFLSLIVVLWLGWFAPGRLSRRALTILGVWWFAAAALLAPLFLGYRAVHEQYGLKRSEVEIEYYSADIAGVLSASRDSLLWGRLRAVEQAESELFPGATIATFVVVGLLIPLRRRGRAVPRADATDTERRKALVFYIGAALLMWLLALGPHPAWSGRRIGVSGPYALLMHLPGFDEMRVPARLWMLAVLCFSAAAALVTASIPSARTRGIVVAAGLLGLLLDGWPRSFTLVAAPDLRPSHHAGAIARLGLPLAANETESMYQTIADNLPVFNGYSGYEAPQHPALRDLLERHDPVILGRLASAGPIDVVVEHELDADGSWRDYVQQAGGRLLESTTHWSRYRLMKGEAAAPAVSGIPLPVVRVESNINEQDINAVLDGDLRTRWHSPDQRGLEIVTVDLGEARSVGSLVLCLGTYTSQYPRDLTIETSVDGTAWSQAWSGRTALLAYDAAITDPRSVPISLPISRYARMIRLRQTAGDKTRGWTIVELRVLG